mmetsp:Transcript_84232/g.239164  ORF Transcript_84232/g.239164 Transcript_84232/m.239164 type:complete len:243 (+) Transcript_84232:2973-3701(+)
MAAAKRLLSMSVDEEGLTWQALLDRYKIRPKHAGNAGAKDAGAEGSRKEGTGEEKEGGVEDREMVGEEKAGGVEDDEYEYDDDFQEAKGDAKHEEAMATEADDEDRWDEEGGESRVRVVLTRNALSAGCRVRICLSDPPAPYPPRPITTGTIAEVLSLALIATAAQPSSEAAHGRGLTWYLLSMRSSPPPGQLHRRDRGGSRLFNRFAFGGGPQQLPQTSLISNHGRMSRWRWEGCRAFYLR